MRNIRYQEKDARDFYSGEEPAKLFSGIAILIDSGFSKIVANFYLGFNKSIVPTKIFTSEEEAILWLETFLNKNEIVNHKKIIETQTANIWLRDDGILKIVIKPCAIDTLISARENVAAIKKFFHGKKI